VADNLFIPDPAVRSSGTLTTPVNTPTRTPTNTPTSVVQPAYKIYVPLIIK